MNYDTWLCGLDLCRHYGVSITLPALLFFPFFFFFAEVCLPISICEIDKNIILDRITVLQAIFIKDKKRCADY